MSLRQKVRDAYLAKQGQTRQPQPQPQQPQSNYYVIQRYPEKPRPRRRIVQPEKKPIDLLRDATDFLKG